MLKHFVKGRKGWWILHILAIALALALGRSVTFM